LRKDRAYAARARLTREGDQSMNDIEAINRAHAALREKLSPFGIASRAGFALRVSPDEQHFNDQRHVELKALKRGQAGIIEIVRVMPVAELLAGGPAQIAAEFGDHAISALSTVSVK
jgi:hypothetical protein